MIEIMTAQSVARETIKNVLETEIPKVNDAILAARKKCMKTCFLKIGISAATAKLLEKAGYYVETDSDSTEISWEGVYHRMMEDEALMEEFSKELNVRIIDADNGGNTIDPNWRPSRDED